MENKIVKVLKAAIAVVAQAVVDLSSEVGRLERENADLKRRVEALESWRREADFNRGVNRTAKVAAATFKNIPGSEAL
jgi:hypothetical protein